MGLSFLGVIAALAMYAVSVSPSLMARSWTWHAVASGILVACGYIAGLVVQNVGLLVIRLTGLTIRASDPAEIASVLPPPPSSPSGGSTLSSSRIAATASPPHSSTCRGRPSANTSLGQQEQSPSPGHCS